MALTDEELQGIISRLSPEERKQLLSQLGRQVDIDNISNPTNSTNTKPKQPPKTNGSKVYCCPLCGSGSYKKHGTTNTGMQRYICKDCGKTFSENYGDSLRYSHLTENQWMILLRGIVNNHSLPQIARDCDIATSTAWSCRMKVNQAIMTMYGYTDLFQGTTEADEYYCRAAF
jgi:transposase-like protein